MDETEITLPEQTLHTLGDGSAGALEYPRWEPGAVLAGTYEVRANIGEGGFGQVYRVYHRKWDLELAVKCARSKSLALSLGEEAQTWIELGLHPHVISCYYVRTIHDHPHLFLELAEGDLRRYLRDNSPSLERALEIAVHAAWGLAHAHAHGLVHQDVKPSNILLGEAGEAKVTDFGLARVLQEGEVGYAGLTVAYASPEQARAAARRRAEEVVTAKITAQSDVWSWAICLLEMLLGEVPCPMGGEAAADVLAALADQPDWNVPEVLHRLLEDCFADEPTARPTIDQAADRLVGIFEELFSRSFPWSQPTISDRLAERLNNRAVSLVDLDLGEKAEELWARALEFEPHHREATFNLGLTLWRKGEWTDEQVLEAIAAASADELLDGIRGERGELTAGRESTLASACLPTLQRTGDGDLEYRLYRGGLSPEVHTIKPEEAGRPGFVARFWNGFAVNPGGVALLTRRIDPVPTAGGRPKLNQLQIEAVLESRQLPQGRRLWALPWESHLPSSAAVSGDGSFGALCDGHAVWRLEMRAGHLSERQLLPPRFSQASGLLALSLGGDLALFHSPGPHGRRPWVYKFGQGVLSEFDNRSVVSGCFSPCGELVAVGDRAGQVRVWDWRRPRLIRTVCEHVGKPVAALLWQDENTLVWVTDGPLEVRSHYPRPANFVLSKIRSARVISEALSSFQKLLRQAEASINNGRPGAAWNLLMQARELPGHSRDPSALEVSVELNRHLHKVAIADSWELSSEEPSRVASPPGPLACEGDEDLVHGQGQTFYRRRGKEVVAVYGRHLGSVCTAAFTADHLISGDTFGELRVWDRNSNSCLFAAREHEKAIQTLRPTSCGRFVFSRCAQGAIKGWDLKTGSCVAVAEEQPQPPQSRELTLRQNDTQLWSASGRGWFLDWELNDSSSIVGEELELRRQFDAIGSAFSSGQALQASKMLRPLSATRPGRWEVRQWELRLAAVLPRARLLADSFERGRLERPGCAEAWIEVEPGQDRVLLADPKGLWEFPTQATRPALRQQFPSSALALQMELSRRGMIKRPECPVKLWCYRHGIDPRDWTGKLPAGRPSGGHIRIASDFCSFFHLANGRLHHHRLADGQLQRSWEQFHVKAFAIAPCAEFVSVFLDDSRLLLLEVRSGEVHASLETKLPKIIWLGFAALGTRLICVSDEGEVELHHLCWELKAPADRATEVGEVYRAFYRHPEGMPWWQGPAFSRFEDSLKRRGAGGLAAPEKLRLLQPEGEFKLEGEPPYFDHQGLAPIHRHHRAWLFVELATKRSQASPNWPLFAIPPYEEWEQTLRDRGGRSALHWAVLSGDPEAVKHLLAQGADPELEDAYGQTPLALACRRSPGAAGPLLAATKLTAEVLRLAAGQRSVFRRLLPQVVGSGLGEQALSYAARSDWYQEVKRLLAAGVRAEGLSKSELDRSEVAELLWPDPSEPAPLHLTPPAEISPLLEWEEPKGKLPPLPAKPNSMQVTVGRGLWHRQGHPGKARELVAKARWGMKDRLLAIGAYTLGEVTVLSRLFEVLGRAAPERLLELLDSTTTEESALNSLESRCHPSDFSAQQREQLGQLLLNLMVGQKRDRVARLLARLNCQETDTAALRLVREPGGLATPTVLWALGRVAARCSDASCATTALAVLRDQREYPEAIAIPRLSWAIAWAHRSGADEAESELVKLFNRQDSASPMAAWCLFETGRKSRAWLERRHHLNRQDSGWLSGLADPEWESLLKEAFFHDRQTLAKAAAKRNVPIELPETSFGSGIRWARCEWEGRAHEPSEDELLDAVLAYKPQSEFWWDRAEELVGRLDRLSLKSLLRVAYNPAFLRSSDHAFHPLVLGSLAQLHRLGEFGVDQASPRALERPSFEPAQRQPLWPKPGGAPPPVKAAAKDDDYVYRVTFLEAGVKGVAYTDKARSREEAIAMVTAGRARKVLTVEYLSKGELS